MQRYRLPGYETQLLGELQRQQNGAQFCDTLLQTEGISVPAHSCILAALSPYLSQKLSASPSPPWGQKLPLQLQAVKAQTLLKLVGLLYSGVVEVKGHKEQRDLLCAARQFGITGLVRGQKDEGMKERQPQRNGFVSCWESEEGGGGERNKRRKTQDAEVQAEIPTRKATDAPIQKRSCVSTGTQTVKAVKKTAGTSCSPTSQTKPSACEPASSSVAQSLDFSTTLTLQNITLDKHCYSTCFTTIPSVPPEAPSDGESAFDRSSDSVTNPTSTSAWSSDVTSFPFSRNDDSNSPTPQEDCSHHQSAEFGDSVETGLKGGKPNAEMADEKENAERQSHISRDAGKEKGNSREKKHAHVGMKNIQNMMETTQISIKVKLRRRTKGEVWEVVRMHDTDDTPVVTSQKADGSDLKRPQMQPINDEPSSVRQGPNHEPETPTPQPAAFNCPEPPPDAQLLCSECLTPNQSEDLELVPLPQPPGPGEDSDEQISKLLEDIMIGLNILPSLERDGEKSHHLHPCHDGTLAACQVTVTDSEPAAVTAAECVYYQDFQTQIGHPLTDTAQDQPSCSSLPSALSDAVVILQQQRRSPQYNSPVASTGQREGMSHQSMPLSESQDSLYPGAPTAASVLPSACYSGGQNPVHPAYQEPSSQDDQNILEFLPLTQAQQSFSVPCMDDMWLPPCLSPLESFPSAEKHKPVRNDSVNLNNKIQPRAAVHGRPWLTENTESLQFPIRAITHRENASVSKPQQKHLEISQQNVATLAEPHTAGDGGTISAGRRNVTGVKSDQNEMKESLKKHRDGADGGAAVPKMRKRKRTGLSPDDACSPLACKDVRVSDGAKCQNSPTVCSVNLSSNNVLAKQRNRTTGSSNMPNNFLAKLDKASTITDRLGEKGGGAADLGTGQTRIRTRALLKRTQETPSNTSRGNSAIVKPGLCRATIVDKEGILPLRRKRGRPRKRGGPRKRGRPQKAHPNESPAAVSKNKSHCGKSERQLDDILSKEEEEGAKTKRMCKKLRRNRSEEEVIPLKRTVSAESTVQAEADDDSDTIPSEETLQTPKRPRTVILKDFQKLAKRLHSKDKETEECAGDVESEGTTCAGRCEELSKEKEVVLDFTQPQSRDETEGSFVIFSATVDTNHNQIFNKPTAQDGKVQQEDKKSSSSEDPGVSFCPVVDVLGDEGAESAAEREQPLKNPDDAPKACDVGVPDPKPQTAVDDEGSSHGHGHTPSQGDKMPSDLDSSLHAPQRFDPSQSDSAGSTKSSGCDRDEEEEQEVEVDILLYSPDKGPQSSNCENELVNVDVSPEEDEDEDVNEIDVTGDEAE